jgi:uncharacterized protein YchJ
LVETFSGVTESERYLAGLCQRNFLRFWSHPNLYRDQGRKGSKGDGKELGDVLVVCGEDIIIFSDKACRFPVSKSLPLAWDRWFRRSIEGSANQVYGAERWLRSFPSRVFRDRACTIPFDIALPASDAARFHRVVVTPGRKDARVPLTDSAPSLRLTPSVTGNDHYTERGGTPFVVGQVDPNKGYVHIWDEVAVGHLMKELDTISDLLIYLRWKEDLVAAGKLLTAASESDLLGYYMYHRRNGSDPKFLSPPPGHPPLSVNAGFWGFWSNGSLRAGRQAANTVSYTIDHLINHMAEQVIAGNTLDPIRDGFATAEQILRQLARESRLARRLIAQAWLKKIYDPRSAKAGFRVIQGIGNNSVYVLFTASRLPDMSEEEYRRQRFNYLEVYCLAVMSTYVPPVHLMGLATEPGNSDIHSTDVVYLDPSKWTPQMQQFAVDARKQTGFFTAVEEHSEFAADSPGGNIDAMSRKIFSRPYSLNGACPCGSGKRFKNCHGKSRKKVVQ